LYFYFYSADNVGSACQAIFVATARGGRTIGTRYSVVAGLVMQLPLLADNLALSERLTP
jgi:hypothetical protein